jgi:phosphopantothenoylcysteine decarboxylase
MTVNALYLVVCAAPPARTSTRAVIEAAQAAGWDVSVVATPTAADGWLPEGLEELTGHRVRSQTRRIDEPRYQPLANAVLVAPATFHTINAWAAGINDTLALGVLNEAFGLSLPIAVVPWFKEALRAHPAFKQNVNLLEAAGASFAPIDPANPPDDTTIAAMAVKTLGYPPAS